MLLESIVLVVGLGNPGQQYLLNRHNIGFLIVDAIAQAHDFPDFKNKHGGLESQLVINDQKVILFKPMTYMNLSGSAVQRLANFYKIKPEQILVIHDDIDLSPFEIRVKNGGGAGGHNGLKSIDSTIGKNYWRLRIGVGHPGQKDLVSDYVLSNFKSTEHNELVDILANISDDFLSIIQKGPDAWFKQKNQKNAAS